MSLENEKETAGYVLNLNELATQAERAKTWSKWLPTAFPGLRVSKLNKPEASALVRFTKIGPMKIHSIIQSSQIIKNNPDEISPSDFTIGLIIIKTGHSEVDQNGEHFQLKKGSMGFIDGGYDFTLESIGTSQTLVITLPRSIIKDRLPWLLGSGTKVFDAKEPLLNYISFFAEQAFNHHGAISSEQESSLFSAFLSLMEGLPTPDTNANNSVHWRVKHGLAEIYVRATESNLTAEDIADKQNISRRRLDQLFLQEIGSTVSFQISDRRMAIAANALCNPENQGKNITTIAYEAGFQDAAHFSRAFKLRFEMTPRQFRKQALKL